MTLFCMATGTIMSYFTLKVGSVIPAILFHSAINALASLSFYFIVPNSITTNEILLIGPIATGILGMSIFVLVALMYLVRSRRMKWDSETEQIVKD